MLLKSASSLKTIIFMTFVATLCSYQQANGDTKYKDNTWYVSSNTDTVIVFIHGALSDSEDAWTNEEVSPPIFWPELVKKDPYLENASIFLGGYKTKISSGIFDTRAAARTLFIQMNVNRTVSGKTVMSHENILFVAHSLGGNVIRQLLVENREKFQHKNVGLALFAAPSIGSKQATRLKLIADFLKNRMGQELQWNHPYLVDLDKSFRNLINDRKIPCLSGVEAIETHFFRSALSAILKFENLVEETSGARYFGEPSIIGDTSHFSIVKPDAINHDSHSLLKFLYEQKLKNTCSGTIIREAEKHELSDVSGSVHQPVVEANESNKKSDSKNTGSAAITNKINTETEEQKILELVSRGNECLVELRLIKPDNNSALYYFEEAIKRDPNNAAARAGLDSIAKKYIALAKNEIREKNYIVAHMFIMSAELTGMAQPEEVSSLKDIIFSSSLISEEIEGNSKKRNQISSRLKGVWNLSSWKEDEPESVITGHIDINSLNSVSLHIQDSDLNRAIEEGKIQVSGKYYIFKGSTTYIENKNDFFWEDHLLTLRLKGNKLIGSGYSASEEFIQVEFTKLY